MLKANKHLNRGTKTQKHKKEQKQRYMTQGNKEKEAKKTRIRVSGLKYACAYMSLHTWASCMRMHTSSPRAHTELCVRRHSPRNPNP